MVRRWAACTAAAGAAGASAAAAAAARAGSSAPCLNRFGFCVKRGAVLGLRLCAGWGSVAWGGQGMFFVSASAAGWAVPSCVSLQGPAPAVSLTPSASVSPCTPATPCMPPCILLSLLSFPAATPPSTTMPAGLSGSWSATGPNSCASRLLGPDAGPYTGVASLSLEPASTCVPGVMARVVPEGKVERGGSPDTQSRLGACPVDRPPGVAVPGPAERPSGAAV